MFNIKRIRSILLRTKSRETGYFLGLDIGTYAVKAVSILKDGARGKVNSYFFKNIPTDQSDITNTRNIVSEVIESVGQAKCPINISISLDQAIVRFITLPKMSFSELENSLVFEADKYIPFNVNEVIMDFYILDYNDNGEMNIILTAAKKDIIKARLDIVEGLGLKVNIIDIDTFALFNALSLASSMKENATNCFIDIGYSKTNIIISVANVPRFTRSIPIGGRDIAQTLAENTGITMEKAEYAKVTNDGAYKDKIEEATKEVLDELVKECQVSFGYFEDKNNRVVESMVFCGGLMRQKGISRYLSDKLGVKTLSGLSLDGMDIESVGDKEDFLSRFSVSMGLAMRG